MVAQYWATFFCFMKALSLSEYLNIHRSIFRCHLVPWFEGQLISHFRVNWISKVSLGRLLEAYYICKVVPEGLT